MSLYLDLTIKICDRGGFWFRQGEGDLEKKKKEKKEKKEKKKKKERKKKRKKKRKEIKNMPKSQNKYLFWHVSSHWWYQSWDSMIENSVLLTNQIR